MREIVIGNKRYAVGLHWRPDSPRPGMETLRREARKLDPVADLVTFRQRQHGFGWSGGDERRWRGVRPLASSLRIPSDGFLGIFRLEDAQGPYWWVFSLFRGQIDNKGDLVFSEQGKAEAWFQGLAGIPEKQFESKRCEDVEESVRWLSALLPTFSLELPFVRGAALTPLRDGYGLRPGMLWAAGGVVVLVCGGFVMKLYLEHEEQERARAAAHMLLVGKEERRREIKAHPEMYFPMQWESSGAVGPLIEAGVGAILGLPVSVSGWVLDGASFTGKEVAGWYAHQPGASFLALPVGARLETPQKAVLSLTVRVSPGERPKGLIAREEASRRLYESAQLLGAHLKLSFAGAQKRDVDGIEVWCPWLEGQWELAGVPSLVVSDGSFPEGFTSFPGLTLSSVSYDKGAWALKGKIYALR